MTWEQILLIIICIIVLAWIINWVMTPTVIVRQPFTQYMDYSAIDGAAMTAPIISMNPMNPVTMPPLMSPMSTMSPMSPMSPMNPMPPSMQPSMQPSMSPSTPFSPTYPSQPISQDPVFILYYFYSPSCGACHKFSPTWNEVSDKFSNVNGLVMQPVDATKSENEALTFYYNIRAFPTIIFAMPDQHMEYKGNRSPQDLHQFVVDNVSRYANQN